MNQQRLSKDLAHLGGAWAALGRRLGGAKTKIRKDTSNELDHFMAS